MKHDGDLKRPRRFEEIIARAWEAAVAEALVRPDEGRSRRRVLEAETANASLT